MKGSLQVQFSAIDNIVEGIAGMLNVVGMKEEGGMYKRWRSSFINTTRIDAAELESALA